MGLVFRANFLKISAGYAILNGPSYSGRTRSCSLETESSARLEDDRVAFTEYNINAFAV